MKDDCFLSFEEVIQNIKDKVRYSSIVTDDLMSEFKDK
jgi:hypothetical protein